MAPSPTGFLHIGGVRTFLFNWLFARGQGGECLLRIENTDTSREVAESVEQIQRSLRWLGIDWDGEVTFQLDRMERCAGGARQLVDEGKAYEDEGAIRFRMPDEGVTGWDDVVRGRIEFPNEQLEDLVLVRSDGRPTYNFASPVEDWLDGITHVIRGDDHISNTPKQIQILQALGSEIPTYAHVPNVFGEDGKKLSKRHGAQSVDDFRRQGYIPEALVNFLALLGWAPDGETTIMSRDELVERFTLERVGASPAVFDFQKLDWLNGVYLRELSPEEYADRLVAYLREQGYEWDEELIRKVAPLVQEKIAKLGEFPDFAGFLFEARSSPTVRSLDRRVCSSRPSRRSRGRAVRGRADRAGTPIAGRAPGVEAARGISADPDRRHRVEGLTRALREPGAARPRRDAQASRDCSRRSGLGGASGSSARWKSNQERRLKLAVGRGSSFHRRSRASNGSERSVDFPFSKGKRSNGFPGVRQGGRARLEPRWAGNRRRVLVVDDEPSLRLLCRVNLELEGYRVLEAATRRRGDDARARAGDIDVVLLDVHVGADDGASCSAGDRGSSCRSPAADGHVRASSSARWRDGRSASRSRSRSCSTPSATWSSRALLARVDSPSR